MVGRLKNKIKRVIANFIASESENHFLLKEIGKINDIRLIENVISLDTFKDQIKLIQPNLDQFARILVLAPHQDDESIGSGGLMKILSQKNRVIKVLFTTDGAQNNIGDPTESAKIRALEAEQALRRIAESIHYLKVSNLNPEFTVSILKDFNQIIKDFKPDLLLLPWMLDFPVKHRQLNHVLFLANKIEDHPSFEIWGYQVHTHIFANVYVDISEVIQDKEKMILAYKSQNEGFRRYDHQTLGLNAWNSRLVKSPTTKYVELFLALPNQTYYKLTEQIYHQNLTEVYKNSQSLLGSMKKLVAEVKNGVMSPG